MPSVSPVLVAFAGALTLAGVRPLMVAVPPLPPPAKAPKMGAPCADVALPNGAVLPAEAGCKVVAARYGPKLAVVVWFVPRSLAKPAADRDPLEDVWGVTIEETAFGAPVTVSRVLTGKKVRISKVGDVTGDGHPDVVLLSGGFRSTDPYYTPMEEGTYLTVWGRRADGFGELGTYPVLAPKWGKRHFTGRFFTVAAAVEGEMKRLSKPARWDFDGTRFVWHAKGEKRVEGVKVSADVPSRAGHPTEHAVDGDPGTAWLAERAGAVVSIFFPRKLRIARLSFSTGYDRLSVEEGDLFWKHGRVRRAWIELDAGPDRIMPSHESTPPGHAERWGGRMAWYRSITTFGDPRWVDYVPSDTYEVDRVLLVIPDRGVEGGTGGAPMALSEIEVYER